MKYSLEYTNTAKKNLKKINRKDQIFILSWINQNLFNTANPRQTGKPLIGEFKGLWRYRVGNYRLVAKIVDAQLIIVFVDIGHRKDIYQKLP